MSFKGKLQQQQQKLKTKIPLKFTLIIFVVVT